MICHCVAIVARRRKHDSPCGKVALTLTDCTCGKHRIARRSYVENGVLKSRIVEA